MGRRKPLLARASTLAPTTQETTANLWALAGKRINELSSMASIKDSRSYPFDQNALCESDSAYALVCVTEWYFLWEFKSWKKPQGIKFENLDLIEPILKLLEQRRRHGAQTLFRWVKGYTGDPGNEAADKLAGKGATREYERRYGRLPGKEKRSVFRYAPFGWKEVRHADGSETLERISQKTMDRIANEAKSRAAARKFKAEKYENKRDRGANMVERLALKQTRREAVAALLQSTTG
ncbi:ribonuclease HI [Alternaria panax]|uniref:Ribonuclease HI n=1 Tax=Alternaria panax TaxID=48097 RepID=A0AAD4IB08_9PLEO|nr:ribonuclease HI [Alternaria panax]